MSDYLNHLVTRHLGLADTIQPEIAPRFAPPAAMIAPVHAAPPDVAEAYDSRRAASSIVSTRAPVIAPHDSYPRDSRSGTIAPLASVEPPESLREAATDQTDEPPRRAQTPTGNAAPTVESPIPVQPARDDSPGDPVAATIRAAPFPQPQNVVRPDVDVLERDQESYGGAERAQRRSATADEPRENPMGGAVVPRGIVRAPDAQPSASEARSATQMPEAAPTIRVTIGRIEVRAVTPPTPAPQRSASAPRVSLDDYLRGRNGGGR